MTTAADQQSARSAGRVPGDWLLHPVALGAACVLGLNDRVLKPTYGNWWTGKLSDVAGLVFFPWLLLCLWELLRWASRRPWRSGRKELAVCIALTVVVFSAVNVSSVAGAAYESLLRMIWAALSPEGRHWAYPGRIQHTVDPTDLLTLPALWVPWALGVRRLSAAGAELRTA